MQNSVAVRNTLSKALIVDNDYSLFKTNNAVKIKKVKRIKLKTQFLTYILCTNRLQVFLSALLLFVFSHQPAFATNNCEILKVGGNSSWQPVGYLNKNTNQLTGISYDLIKYIGQELNIPVQISSALPWKRLLKTVQEGKLDILLAAYKTEERAKSFHYSTPYYANEARIFVKKGREFKFKKFEDLHGLKGIIPLGGSYGEDFDNFAKKNGSLFVNVSSYGSNFKLKFLQPVLQGYADYFIRDYQDGLSHLKKNNLTDQFITLPVPVSKLNVHFLISRNASCADLLPKVNRIVKHAKNNGVLKKIISQYQVTHQN